MNVSSAMQLLGERRQAANRGEKGRGAGGSLAAGRAARGAALWQVERVSSPIEHEARRFELGRIIGNAEGKRLEVGKPRAELLPLFHMRDGALQTELGAPERAGGDVQAPAVERAH